MPNYFRENIISISTSFKNNIPFGETNILYKNGTKISLLLNEFGFCYGAQNYFNEYNKLIKIKQITLDENLEWIKKHDFYFILYKNSGMTNILATVGNYYKPGKNKIKVTQGGQKQIFYGYARVNSKKNVHTQNMEEILFLYNKIPKT